MIDRVIEEPQIGCDGQNVACSGEHERRERSAYVRTALACPAGPPIITSA